MMSMWLLLLQLTMMNSHLGQSLRESCYRWGHWIGLCHATRRFRRLRILRMRCHHRGQFARCRCYWGWRSTQLRTMTRTSYVSSICSN
uniref:Putative secreted protein n=1 Tax=Anopheles marajoara TaxID=58244 RepID=A0A2M4CAW8_9DIPT